jgi:hypothetical protein
METWAMIFTGGMQDVGIVDPEAFLFGNTAFVINYESTGGVFLVATNHFVLEDGEWRLTHHQGGPVSAPAPGAMVM